MRQSRVKKHERKKKSLRELGVLVSVIFLTLSFYFIFVYDGSMNQAKGESNKLPDQSVLDTNSNEEEVDIEKQNSEDLTEADVVESEHTEEMLKSKKEREKKLKEDESKKKKTVKKEQNTTGEKKVYLTFDDGPRDITMDILNLLDEYNAKATFFMLEPHMKQYPDVINEMIKRGHSVGVHSVTHNKNKVYASSKSIVNEMTVAKNTLEELTDVESHLMRVPYGSVPHMTPEYILAVENEGFIMWDWNIDSLDWKLGDGSYVNHTIDQLESFDKNEPMVILMHDRKTTVKHLEKLLKYLQENNYDMLAINESMTPVQFIQ